MLEKLLITVLPLIYLGSFIARNLGVKRLVRGRIRAADPLVNASVLLMALCILITILSVYAEGWYGLMGALGFLNHKVIAWVGLSLFCLGILLGWVVSGQLKTSWRVGVHPGQETALIQSGVYARVRNPYFSACFLLLLGLFLVRPSIVGALLALITGGIFHLMVRKEEAHLLRQHGWAYTRYRQTTGRYLPWPNGDKKR